MKRLEVTTTWKEVNWPRPNKMTTWRLFEEEIEEFAKLQTFPQFIGLGTLEDFKREYSDVYEYYKKMEEKNHD